jgi:hypothetical protein
VIDRIEFGQRLRRERERRGIRLETIAQSTKIKASLLDALERGDVSHWPAGIFGRGFLRAYLNAIHLAPEPLVAEFQSFSTVGSPASGAAAGAGTRNADGLRLTLDPDSAPLPAITGRLAAAIAEPVMVLAAAALFSQLAGVSFWIAGTVAVSMWSAVATVWLGRSPALWLASRRGSRAIDEAVYVDILPDSGGTSRLTLAGD